jgi:predicted acylesterase/phospholipase RssA
MSTYPLVSAPTKASVQQQLIAQLPETADTFHLGFSMAGAISAGAYTAGVMDYLLEALERWEVAKKTATGKVPTHKIKIDVLGGASAGGMTAAVTSVTVHNPLNPINDRTKLDDEEYTSKNLLYDCWVNLITDYALADLLSVKDIKDGQVVSLLNSKVVDDIADLVKKAAKKVKGTNLPVFFDDEFEVLMALSNITGIPFKVSYDGTISGAETYIARRDFVHLKVMEQDNPAFPGRIPYYLKPEKNFQLLIDAARATGAFPIGLAPRIVNRPKKYIEENPFINVLLQNTKITNTTLSIPDPYKTLNVDGGVFNNDPLTVTRQVLKKIVHSKTPPELLKSTSADIHPQFDDKGADFAVIMVDPFPSVDDKTSAPKGKDSLLTNMIPNLIGAMRSQLLFDVQDVQEAMDESDYNTFLIAPKRDDFEDSKAIACGSLGGFGGFLKKDFRVHDFFLGRRNCQWFLKNHLALPMQEKESGVAENPIITSGYPQNIRDKFKLAGSNGKYFLPLIPDVTETGELNEKTEELLPFPFLTEDELQQYHPLVAQRFKKIADNMGLTGITKTSVSVSAFLLKGIVANKVLDYIRQDLKSRKLYKP